MSLIKFGIFKHGEEFDPYRVYPQLTMSVQELVVWHMQGLLTSVRRKMKGRRSLRNKRLAKVDRIIHWKLVMEMYRIFYNLKYKAGFVMDPCTHMDEKKFKNMEISFFDKGRFLALMDLFGVDVREFLKRELPGGTA